MSATQTPNRYMDPKLPGFLDLFGIDLFLDVGANAGQFANELIESGYDRKIVSFEPLAAAYTKLSANSRGHDNWILEERCAIGAEHGEATINVASNLESSSILGMLDMHIKAAPASRYVDTETVPMRTLDELAARHTEKAGATFLKIDVQGLEDQVLLGASQVLPSISGIQVEMSLVPLYDGERRLDWWLPHMESLGLDLWHLKPGFTDSSTGRTLQVDGLFFRPETGSL